MKATYIYKEWWLHIKNWLIYSKNWIKIKVLLPLMILIRLFYADNLDESKFIFCYDDNWLIELCIILSYSLSFQLLDCFTIPAVLVLSWLFLRVRYKILHVLGVGLCLLGVGSLVFADIMVEKWQGDGKSTAIWCDLEMQ